MDLTRARRQPLTYLTVTVSGHQRPWPIFERGGVPRARARTSEVGYEVLTIRAYPAGSAPSKRQHALPPAGARAASSNRRALGAWCARGPWWTGEEEASYQLLVGAKRPGHNPDAQRPPPCTSWWRTKRQLPPVQREATWSRCRRTWPSARRCCGVQATDSDQGQNAAIHYSIVSGNLKGQFYLHSLSGSLGVINPAGLRDHPRSTLLRIKAQDGGRPPLINSSGLVSVQILDVNDNAPIFVSSPFQAAVLERACPWATRSCIQAVG